MLVFKEFFIIIYESLFLISDCSALPDARPPPPSAAVHSSESQADSAGMLQRPVPSSKPQSSRRARDKTRRYPQDVQSHQLQRAATLGPPGRGRSPEAKGDQLKRLEQRLEQLAVMLDMLKTQVALIQPEECKC